MYVECDTCLDMETLTRRTAQYRFIQFIEQLSDCGLQLHGSDQVQIHDL